LLVGAGGAMAVLAGCAGGGDGDGAANETTTTEMETTTTEADGGTETTTEATETTTAADTANVRVAHVSPDAPAVDVLVDGSAVLEEVSFGTVSDYLEVPGGDRQVEITAAGGDPSVFSGTVTVTAGMDYTLAAVGEISEGADQPFEVLVLEDDNSDPGADTARLRAVHASPDAPAVDVTAADVEGALFDGVAFGDAAYVEVPGGDYTVQIRPDTETNDGEVAAEFDVSLEGGQVYTAFAAGYLNPAEAPADTPFDLIVVQDTGGMSG